MVTLDPSSADAPYEQVRDQLRAQVESGELTPGTRLPTVRALAADLGLAANTVARAYRELESAGVVEKRRTAGTYVSGQGSPLARRERMKILSERIDALLAEARQMDIPFDDVMKLAERRHLVMQPASAED
jgi:DNA-binding transcriptional regulator YhcF (GntR family)